MKSMNKLKLLGFRTMNQISRVFLRDNFFFLIYDSLSERFSAIKCHFFVDKRKV